MIKKNVLLSVLIVFIIMLCFPAAKTFAQDPPPWEITVDSTLDATDVANNSVCSAITPTEGPCTLRAAIDEANKCTLDLNTCEGGVVIHVPPGTYTLTIPPSGGNDNYTGDLDINLWYKQPVYIIEGTDRSE